MVAAPAVAGCAADPEAGEVGGTEVVNSYL